MRYVALLRGVNVGGHKPLKMADLRKAFDDMGFANVLTVQASGNVLFDAAGTEAAEDIHRLAARIEEGLGRIFGSSIAVIVRPFAEIERLVASDPFKGVAIGPDTRLYVTFLSPPAGSGTGISPEDSSRGIADAARGNVRRVDATAGHVLTVITVSPRWGTTELMAWLEREYGAGITTRNWNTIAKIARS